MNARAGSSPGKVLLLGASGFLGPFLEQSFGTNDVIRTYSGNPASGGVRFDARTDSVASLLPAKSDLPRAAVILFGQTNVDACAKDPAGTAELNVGSVIRVVDELRSLGIAPVFTSSDAVFDGSRGNWREDDSIQPILTYGRQKHEVERYLLSLPVPGLVVRLPKLLSPSRHLRCMLTDWVVKMGRGDRIQCAVDQYFTPAGVDDVAGAIAQLVHAGASGVYHLGGSERLSRRVLLQAVVDEFSTFATPQSAIEDCSLRDIPVFDPRPLDSSMDSSKLEREHGLRLRGATSIAKSAVRDCLGAASGL